MPEELWTYPVNRVSPTIPSPAPSGTEDDEALGAPPHTGATSTDTSERRLRRLGEDDPLDRRDVAVVATPGDGHVPVVDPLVVGRVDREPLTHLPPAPSPAPTPPPTRERRRRRRCARAPAGAGWRGSRSRSGRPARACAGTRWSGARSPGRRRPARWKVSATVEVTVVAVESYLKSAWIRCIRSVTASPMGRPGSSDRAPYACASAVCSTAADGSAKSVARHASGRVGSSSGRARSHGTARAASSYVGIDTSTSLLPATTSCGGRWSPGSTSRCCRSSRCRGTGRPASGRHVDLGRGHRLRGQHPRHQVGDAEAVGDVVVVGVRRRMADPVPHAPASERAPSRESRAGAAADRWRSAPRRPRRPPAPATRGSRRGSAPGWAARRRRW